MKLPEAALPAVLALPLLFPAAPMAAGTYQCRTPDGSTVFAQFGCPTGTVPAASVSPSAGDSGSFSVIDSPALTDAEQRRLADLARRTAAAGSARARQQARARQAQAAARQSTRERCAAALKRLDDLAAARRRGYSAADDRRWDDEEDRLEATRRRDC